MSHSNQFREQVYKEIIGKLKVKKKGIAELCTAFGKTQLAISIMNLIHSSRPEAKFLVVTNSIALKKQWVERYASTLPYNIEVKTMIDAGHGTPGFYDFIVYDEGGAYVLTPSYRKAYTNNTADYELVLDAHIIPEGKTFLGEMGFSLLKRVSRIEAEANKVITPTRLCNVFIELTPLELEKERILTEEIRGYVSCFPKGLDIFGPYIPKDFKEAAYAMGVTVNSLIDMQAKNRKAIGKREDLTLYNPKKIKALKSIVTTLDSKRIIVFSEKISQCREAWEQVGGDMYTSDMKTGIYNNGKLLTEVIKDRKYFVNGVGYTLKELNKQFGAIERRTAAARKSQILDDFSSGAIDILLTPKSIERGYSVEDCNLGARLSRKSGKMAVPYTKQILGRVRDIGDFLEVCTKGTSEEKKLLSIQDKFKNEFNVTDYTLEDYLNEKN